MAKIKSYSVVALLALVLFLSLLNLGGFTLFDVDEAVFSEATKEMIQSGDWVTPTYNGVNRYDKPIFFYWLMAGSYKIFGINEFGARFPSAMLGVVLCVAVYFFVRRFRGGKEAVYSVVALGLSIFFVVYSHAAVTDMTLTCFISLSLFSFYLSLKKRGFVYGFYAFSALAFLTKGLVGVIFPFGIAFLYLLFREGLRGCGKLFDLRGVLLFFALSAPWYAAETAANGSEFLRQFFLKHHFMRYTDVISGHRGPVFYYLIVLSIGLFPWIAFLPAGIRRVFREREDLNLFALVWFGVIVVFFSFSTTKLPNYILPAIPAACIIIAYGMEEPDSRWRRFANVCVAAMSVSLAIAALYYLRRYLQGINVTDTNWTYIVAALMSSLAAVSVYAVFKRRTFYAATSCIIFLFLFLLIVKALPAANRQLQGTLYRYSLFAGRVIPDGGRIITYRLNNPSIVFYSGHRVLYARNENELMSRATSPMDRIAIAKTKDIEPLKKIKFELLESDGTYAILERKWEADFNCN